MAVILLNADERRQWEAAVATWPTCPTCGGDAFTEDFNRKPTYEVCPDCVAGRVPQPVYIVIEGEPHEHDGNTSGCRVRPGVWQCATDTCTGSFHDDDLHEYGLVVPARWRVPVGEPCEIRAECDHRPYYPACMICQPLGAATTVEALPVEIVECDHGKWRVQAGGRWFDADHVGLDLVGGVGRHFVAVVTP